MEDFENFVIKLNQEVGERKKYKNEPAPIKQATKKTKGGYKVNRNGKPIIKK